jgi:hypothetical protein
MFPARHPIRTAAHVASVAMMVGTIACVMVTSGHGPGDVFEPGPHTLPPAGLLLVLVQAALLATALNWLES